MMKGGREEWGEKSDKGIEEGREGERRVMKGIEEGRDGERRVMKGGRGKEE